ncbi:MAG TPA: riboflavin synthase [Armatimonadota bacterium]|nr:riboflavin synthase [Armatimonadota bacterium]
MFTGLVEEVGEITELRPREGGRDVVIHAPGMGSDLELGESVAVNGTCLTVEHCDASGFTAHAGEETLRRTTLGTLSRGSAVNIERALTPHKRLGGHFVQGHVDGVGSVRAVRPTGTTVHFDLDAPRELLRYVVEKGSITVAGISLTVVDCSATTFSVAVIPHTLAETALGARRAGDKVNIEVDVLAKYVEKLLAPRTGEGGGITESFLREHGFE